MVELYLQYEYWVAVVQLVLAMLGMGAGLQVADFHKVVQQPKAVSLGLMMQLIMVPLIAFGFISYTNLSSGMVIGIAIIAAIPGGATSNIFTFLAKGNIPLSISITALTSFACLVTTPAILDFLIADFMPNNFSMPTMRVAIEIGLCLLVPLLVGMSFLRRYPKYAPQFSTFCVRGSLLGIVVIVLGSLGAGRINFVTASAMDLAWLCLFILSLTIAGIFITKTFGLSKAENTAIEMEVVVRNINLGLLIKISLFPLIAGQTNPLADTVLLSLLLYGGWQLIMGFIFITWRRKQAS
jgi:BASS family bile acid:Na+ symporter